MRGDWLRPLLDAAPRSLRLHAALGQVVITVAPPAPIVETVPPSPGPNWVWDGGYHAWRGGKYVWVPGHYIKKPRPNAAWVAGHYDKRGRGWVYVPGRWH